MTHQEKLIRGLEARIKELTEDRDALLLAAIEATNLFDNYPDLYEMKGTLQVLNNAIYGRKR